MMCREEITIEAFDDLKSGDHIATRGNSCCGCFYDHHAIFIKINNGNEADGATNGNATYGGNQDIEITVVDVDRKGFECVKCHGRKMSCCCGFNVMCCCCCKSKYQIKEHGLFGKPWKLPKKSNIFTFLCGMVCTILIKLYDCMCCKEQTVITQKIKRISYMNPRNNHSVTRNLAQRFKDSGGKQNDLEYCLIGQNCEHFASACVNGKKNMTFDDLRHSMSQQSRKCLWRMMHVLFLLLQGAFYGLNFCIYAVFVAKDESFNVFSPGGQKFLEHVCYHPENNVQGFNTTCDWMVVAIFIGSFTIVFILTLFCFYQPHYNNGFICRQCLIVARLDCFSKVFTFVVIEAVSIFLEKPSYKHVAQWHVSNGVALVVFGISVIGALLVYSVSSLLTWVLGMCIIPTCVEVRSFTKYFNFRGITRLIVWFVRCFIRRGNALYLRVCPR